MKLIDCGPYCVWTYQRPGRKTPDMITEWAFAFRCTPSQGDFWETSKSSQGYSSRQEAETAAQEICGR